MREFVYDRDSDIEIVLVLWQQCQCPQRDMMPSTYGVGVLAHLRGTGGKNVGRVKLREHCIGLTCVDHEENLIVTTSTSDTAGTAERQHTASSATSVRTRLQCQTR